MTSLLMTRSVDAQEVLTNQSVVELVKAGLSERVIIAKIRNSPTKFDTQTDALIALKKNGVPEKVIEAIMSPSAGRCRRAAGVECSGRERGDGGAARRGRRAAR